MLKVPSEVLMADDVTPVSLFVTTICAFAITAPLESVTVPLSPVPAWAFNRTTEQHRLTHSAIAARTPALDRLCKCWQRYCDSLWFTASPLGNARFIRRQCHPETRCRHTIAAWLSMPPSLTKMSLSQPVSMLIEDFRQCLSRNYWESQPSEAPP